LIERIKQVVAQLLSEFARPQVGNVWDYDPVKYAVKVELQPTGEVTGWIPLGSPWVGNGFGMVVAPNIGDMVKVEFIDGSWQAAVTGQRFFNDNNPPPECPAGEFWLVHQTGSLLKFLADGSVLLTAHTNLTATVGGNLAANVTGTATITAPTVDVNASSAANITTPTATVNGNAVVTGNVTIQGTLTV
jgi:phage baseplate assembly protein gpV